MRESRRLWHTRDGATWWCWLPVGLPSAFLVLVAVYLAWKTSGFTTVVYFDNSRLLWIAGLMVGVAVGALVSQWLLIQAQHTTWQKRQAAERLRTRDRVRTRQKRRAAKRRRTLDRVRAHYIAWVKWRRGLVNHPLARAIVAALDDLEEHGNILHESPEVVMAKLATSRDEPLAIEAQAIGIEATLVRYAARLDEVERALDKLVVLLGERPECWDTLPTLDHARLVAQLFQTAQVDMVMSMRELAGGYSGNRVAQVTVRRRSGTGAAPQIWVLKSGYRRDIQKESEAFKKVSSEGNGIHLGRYLVKDNDITEQPLTHGPAGGLVWWHATPVPHSDLPSVLTLRDYWEQHATDMPTIVTRLLTKEHLSFFYTTSTGSAGGIDLWGHFNFHDPLRKRIEDGATKLAVEVSELMGDAWAAWRPTQDDYLPDVGQLPGLDGIDAGRPCCRWPNPLTWINHEHAGRWLHAHGANLVYVHGDLNERNVLLVVEPNKPADSAQLMVIDFEHAHHGHLFTDFARLEATFKCVLNSLPSDAELLAVVKAEIALLFNADGKPYNDVHELLVKAPRRVTISGASVSVAACVDALRRALYNVWKPQSAACPDYYLALLRATLPMIYYQQCDLRQRLFALLSASLLCSALDPAPGPPVDAAL